MRLRVAVLDFALGLDRQAEIAPYAINAVSLGELPDYLSFFATDLLGLVGVFNAGKDPLARG